MKPKNSKPDYVKFPHAHDQVSICFHCKTNTQILKDNHHDMIYCHNCGMVLREGFDNYYNEDIENVFLDLEEK